MLMKSIAVAVAVAGLALLGAFGSALMGAVSAPEGREAAVVTFVVTASGLAFLGIELYEFGQLIADLICLYS